MVNTSNSCWRPLKAGLERGPKVTGSGELKGGLLPLVLFVVLKFHLPSHYPPRPTRAWARYSCRIRRSCCHPFCLCHMVCYHLRKRNASKSCAQAKWSLQTREVRHTGVKQKCARYIGICWSSYSNTHELTTPKNDSVLYSLLREQPIRDVYISVNALRKAKWLTE